MNSWPIFSSSVMDPMVLSTHSTAASSRLKGAALRSTRNGPAGTASPLRLNLRHPQCPPLMWRCPPRCRLRRPATAPAWSAATPAARGGMKCPGRAVMRAFNSSRVPCRCTNTTDGSALRMMSRYERFSALHAMTRAEFDAGKRLPISASHGARSSSFSGVPEAILSMFVWGGAANRRREIPRRDARRGRHQWCFCRSRPRPSPRCDAAIAIYQSWPIYQSWTVPSTRRLYGR